ncbi:MAG: hypothetical protein FJ224_05945 [Lentisphaerae bacterium]|nr:hypothetical protein [Lentisphaerota bacterium]
MGSLARLSVVTFLTVVRLPLVLLFLVGAVTNSVAGEEAWLFAMSFASLIASAVTDLFDGWLARRLNVVTMFGAHADPLMDKFFYLASLPLLVFVAQRNGNEFHSVLLLVLTILFLLRDQWVTFLRSMGSIFNVSGAADWSGKLRTAVNFPLICAVYFYEEAPAGLQFIPAWAIYAFEALGVAVTLVSLYTYTRRYWPCLARAVRPHPVPTGTRDTRRPAPESLSPKEVSIETMASGISHDLNNLLSAISGNVAVMLKKLPADAPVRENAEEIKATADEAVSLSADVLRCAGKGQFDFRPFSASEWLAALEERVRAACPANTSLDVKIGPDLPDMIADRRQLDTAALNVIQNAFDAMGENQGRLTLSAARRETKTGPGILIEIEDTGCGMPPELLSRVGDPFFTTRIRGRGMGIPLARGIVKAHGGTLEIRSVEGKGTTASILLPAARPIAV